MQPVRGAAEVKLFSDGDEVFDQPQVQAFHRQTLSIAYNFVLDLHDLREA
jgi:hypothetical protein